MKLIVGLGNPGSEYASTRHNAGFMLVDRLAFRHHLLPAKIRFHAAMREGSIAGDKCIILQPQTFMNRSGLSVREALDFYKLTPGDVMVLVDDIALPCGRIRLRSEGSAGGHNGLADIERVLGTKAYPRLRIGVDAPPPQMAQADYVLGRFSPDQMKTLATTLDFAADAVECWIAHDIETAMNRYNPEK